MDRNFNFWCSILKTTVHTVASYPAVVIPSNEAYVKPLLYRTHFIGSVVIDAHLILFFASYHSKYGTSRKIPEE